jgi:hypothetical protein
LGGEDVSRLRKLPLAFVALALVCLAPAAAEAEAIVITSGSYTVLQPDRNYATLSNGGNFSFNAEGTWGAHGCFFGCRPGTVVSPGLGPVTFNHPTVIYNGGVYRESLSPFTSITNSLRFEGTSFTVDPNNLVRQVPFTFQGSVAVSDINNQLFNVQLTGSGVATFNFFLDFSGMPTLRSVTYEFQPQATPEPASLILFGGGAATLGAILRRRRRERRDS